MTKIARPNETVQEHLENVSRECESMCAKFGMPKFGKIVGMCHDAYKDSDTWQKYINAKIAYKMNGMTGIKPAVMSHALESAIYLAWRLGKSMSPDLKGAMIISELMAQCIVSHHNGLHDAFLVNNGTDIIKEIDKVFIINDNFSFADTKQDVLSRTNIDLTTIDDGMFDHVFEKDVIDGLKNECKNMCIKGTGEFFIRMIYSCLVDADRLDAELYDTNGPEKDKKRKEFDDIHTLLDMMEKHIHDKIDSRPDAKSPVNVKRTNVRNMVADHATDKKGIYNLVLPTGAGKTITGMYFALKHADFHKMDRVIVLAPLTTVVDQTATTYTEIFKDKNVIEHQCDFDVLEKKGKKGFRKNLNELEERMALIVENWNLPIIVTTTVQFFESLLQWKANNTRKIHSIANSVIIIDEEQQLPIEHIYPITNALNVLVKDFGCTIVRSTATLPAFDGKIKIGQGKTVDGYDGSVMLVDNVNDLFNDFKRNDFKFIGKKQSSEIARMISDETQSFLCVTNTRKKCRVLYDMVAKSSDDKYMLSKDLCPKDRKRLIKDIADRLQKGDKITVVSTSLVEAGVDFDFDVALREMNSWYSIKQTGGRCNRNGKKSVGFVYVFEMLDYPIENHEYAFEKKQIMEDMLDVKTGQLPMNIGEHDLNMLYSEKEIYHYGQKVENSLNGYKNALYTSEKIRKSFHFFNYKTYGESFHMIEAQRGFPIVVIYRVDDNDHEIDKLLNEARYHFDKKIQRKLQQYVVEVNKNTAEMLYNSGMVEELESNGNKLGLYVLQERNFAGDVLYVKGSGISLEDVNSNFMIA